MPIYTYICIYVCIYFQKYVYVCVRVRVCARVCVYLAEDVLVVEHFLANHEALGTTPSTILGDG